MNEHQGSSGEQQWRMSLDRGEVEYRVVAPCVVLLKFTGHMEPSVVSRIRDSVAVVAEPGKQVDLFFDTEAMTGYHPRFREQMTAWHAALKPQTRSANVLVKSKLISMAIAVANLVTGGILKSFAERGAFEQTLADVCSRPSLEK
jgi:hypothetical protein